jgi:GDP-D-mannose dehydratase
MNVIKILKHESVNFVSPVQYEMAWQMTFESGTVILDEKGAFTGITGWKQHVRYDKRYERPAEVDLLLGNPAKAKQKLGWEPKVRLEELVQIMVDADLEETKQQLYERIVASEGYGLSSVRFGDSVICGIGT